MQIIQREEPRSGRPGHHHVDRRMQEAAERAMAGKAGAVVVMDPRNGDVLAMTSSPGVSARPVHRDPRPRRVAAAHARSHASAA